MDEIERQYKQQINIAISKGDNDLAMWYAEGLRQYRAYYKAEE